MSITLDVFVDGLPAGPSVLECTELVLSWNQPPPVNVSIWYSTSMNENASVDSSSLGISNNLHMLWTVDIPPVNGQLFWFTAQAMGNSNPTSTSAMHMVIPGNSSCLPSPSTTTSSSGPSVGVAHGIIIGSVSLVVCGVLVMVYVIHRMADRYGDRGFSADSYTLYPPTLHPKSMSNSTRSRALPTRPAAVYLAHTLPTNSISIRTFLA